jgi:hypothetical protein
MKLTENFTLSEMVKSETALRNNLDNTPGAAEIANLKVLAEKVLQPIRDHYKKGIKVNSGFRHPKIGRASCRERV